MSSLFATAPLPHKNIGDFVLKGGGGYTQATHFMTSLNSAKSKVYHSCTIPKVMSCM